MFDYFLTQRLSAHQPDFLLGLQKDYISQFLLQLSWNSVTGGRWAEVIYTTSRRIPWRELPHLLHSPSTVYMAPYICMGMKDSETAQPHDGKMLGLSVTTWRGPTWENLLPMLECDSEKKSAILPSYGDLGLFITTAGVNLWKTQWDYTRYTFW